MRAALRRLPTWCIREPTKNHTRALKPAYSNTLTRLAVAPARTTRSREEHHTRNLLNSRRD